MQKNRCREKERRYRERKRIVRMRRTGLFLAVCSILLVIGSFGIWSVQGERTTKSKSSESKVEQVFRMSSKKEYHEVQRIQQDYEELLVLANKENMLPQNYKVNLRKICNGRLEAADVLCDDLTKMLADAREEGYQYYIASAYRTREYQRKLIDHDVKKHRGKGMSYEEALQETYRQVMPAGYSEHETGLALDILVSGNSNMDLTQEVFPGNQWLRTHCAEYGFVLRYPKEKEEITGIDYEPWHFRYVGKEAAEYLTKYNLTLEEFWKIYEKSENHSGFPKS
ncbi:MAG: M15 family metallopeptidase [Lachnospiraceae bacterium]|jgi:D-alanyl-D-alanine carboxypeptidase|nr:M15 family metallopeptidase [Lachnospiraceae bacterium]